MNGSFPGPYLVQRTVVVIDELDQTIVAAQADISDRVGDPNGIRFLLVY
ncbi:MAG: hypothetical protein ACYC1I_12290 [Acidimicrobiales bacterium]